MIFLFVFYLLTFMFFFLLQKRAAAQLRILRVYRCVRRTCIYYYYICSTLAGMVGAEAAAAV